MEGYFFLGTEFLKVFYVFGDGFIFMYLELIFKRFFDYFIKKEFIKFRGGEMGDILY